MFRSLLAPFRALPDFVIIGVHKCGTTSMYEYLATHPKVLKAERKELHFFDNDFHRGPFWYRKHFPFTHKLKKLGAITGESTPNYLHYPYSAERMAAVLPNAKLIAILRNPVDRAFSHYHWEVRHGREKASMTDAIKREQELLQKEKTRLYGTKDYRSGAFHNLSYLDRGKYAEQLEFFYKHFSRDQILVVRNEDLNADIQAVFDRTIKFLGLEPHKLPDQKPHNKGTYSRSADEESLRQELTQYFQPYNQQLYELLQLDKPWW